MAFMINISDLNLYKVEGAGYGYGGIILISLSRGNLDLYRVEGVGYGYSGITFISLSSGKLTLACFILLEGSG